MSLRRPLRHLLSGLALLCLGVRLSAAPYVFTTIAGTPSQGYADGAGNAAKFALPQAIARASDGSLYVSDYNNCVIRKVAADGTVSTFSGSGVFGAVDGPADRARFGAVFGIAVDRSGNVFVTDSYASTVRKISPNGTVMTFAGSPGKTGSVDGVGSAARFDDPRGLAIDGSGNLYVADLGTFTIRKITTDGTVTTLAGSAGAYGATDGVGSAARFYAPYGIAADAQGNVYVADWMDSTIRKITPDGTVTTIVGSSGYSDVVDAIGRAARFDTPDALAVDATGNLFVTDRIGHVVRKITPQGAVTTIAGGAYLRGYRDGAALTARFDAPTGVAVDPSGNLYIVDTYNCEIRKMSADGVVTTLAGQTGAGTADGMRASARFYSPDGVTVDAAGNVYVADTYNHTIRKITPDGTVTTVAGLGGVQGNVDGTTTDARFRYPETMAVDASGNIYVADYTNQTIRKITPSGLVGTLAGLARTPGSADGAGAVARFFCPSDIKLDASGNLVVCDSYNSTIRRVTPDGVVTTIAGQVMAVGDADGPAAQAKFYMPSGIAFDKAGNLYIADTGNNVIRKLTPAGTVSTIAGVSGETGAADGKGANARFDSPNAVAVDASGNVIVADTGNNLIRQITPDGTVTTIGGYGSSGWSDGMGTDTEFSSPYGIATDAIGNLYIADSRNNVIRKGGLTGVAEPASRLFNLSVRANLVANQTLITGFVVSGAAKSILVRAVGPGLAPYAGGALTAGNPKLTMYDGALNLEMTNEDWGGTDALRNTFASVGAFPLPNDSLDAAAVRAISGSHTVHVVSPAAGMALVEAYDAGSGTGSRMINLSARYPVGTGSGALIAGFNISGTSPKTVLIRGIGPTLAGFGVPSPLSDPRIELYRDGQQKIAENDNWSPALYSTFSQLGAFQLDPGSKDAALLISLPPGSYTAQLSGVGGATGEGLIEVYDVGN